MAQTAILRAVVEASTGQAEVKLASIGTQIRALAKSGGTDLGALKTIGLASFAALGVAAVKFGVDSVQAFERHQVVMSQMQAQWKKIPSLAAQGTASFEKQALSLEHLTGVEHDQALAADTVLARFDLTGKQIQTVLPLVEDYARVSGQDVPTAAALVGKALLGNAKALKTIGIQYKATGDRGKDFNTIVSDLTQKVGGAAVAYGQTLPGAMDILKASVNDLEESFGAKLAPAIEQGARDLTDFANAAGPAVSAVGSFASTVGKLVDNNLHPLHSIMHPLSTAQSYFTDTTKKAADALAAEGHNAHGAELDHRGLMTVIGLSSAVTAGYIQTVAAGVPVFNTAENAIDTLKGGVDRYRLSVVRIPKMATTRAAFQDQTAKTAILGYMGLLDSVDGRIVRTTVNTNFTYSGSGAGAGIGGHKPIDSYGGQHGLDMTVNRPTLFLAGERNTRERVSITPTRQGGGPPSGSSSSLTVNVHVHGNVIGMDNFERAVMGAVNKGIGRRLPARVG